MNAEQHHLASVTRDIVLRVTGPVVLECINRLLRSFIDNTNRMPDGTCLADTFDHQSIPRVFLHKWVAKCASRMLRRHRVMGITVLSTWVDFDLFQGNTSAAITPVSGDHCTPSIITRDIRDTVATFMPGNNTHVTEIQIPTYKHHIHCDSMPIEGRVVVGRFSSVIKHQNIGIRLKNVPRTCGHWEARCITAKLLRTDQAF